MPTAPGFGTLSSVQIGLESTYNTGVAATKRLGGFVSSTLKPFFSATIIDPTLNGSLVIANTYPKGLKVAGQLKMILDYEGLNYLFDAVYGTDTFGSQGGVDSGAGPYVHTFTERKYLNSLTIEYGASDIPAGKINKITGAKIIGYEIDVNAAGIAFLTLDILGAGWTPNVSPTGALSAVTRVPAFFDDFSVVDDGSGDGVDIIGQSLKISMKSAVKERFALGSGSLLEPIRNGYVASEISFVREYNSYAQVTKFLAGTNVVPIFRFTNGTKYMEFRMGSGALVDVDAPVPGPDIITQSIRINAKLTAGSPSYGLKAIIQNTQATSLT